MRRPRFGLPAVLATGAVAVLGAGSVIAVGLGGLGAAHGRSAAAAPPAPPPPVVLAVAFDRSGHVPWNRPLQIRVSEGHLVSVSARDDAGAPVTGGIDPTRTSWSAQSTLVPLAGYSADVTVRDLAGRVQQRSVRVTATDSAEHLDAILSPGDGDVVGVGMPVVVYFDRWVRQAERAAVERRLSVATSPHVAGAWHWMSGEEVHWRPPAYWLSGTRVSVRADLRRLDVGDGVWGRGAHAVTFTIGAQHISLVDVAAHTMTVRSNGQVVRVMPISAGRDKYPTMGGVHIALEKDRQVVMDSQTVGIPRNSPDGYYETVYWNVRISYGGAFVHAAPWSVSQQGRVNVSHGCVNLSPANATWFYYFAQRGDVIDIVHTPRPPSLTDPGTEDWNMSWSEWLAGDALRS